MVKEKESLHFCSLDRSNYSSRLLNCADVVRQIQKNVTKSHPVFFF